MPVSGFGEFVGHCVVVWRSSVEDEVGRLMRMGREDKRGGRVERLQRRLSSSREHRSALHTLSSGARGTWSRPTVGSPLSPSFAEACFSCGPLSAPYSLAKHSVCIEDGPLNPPTSNLCLTRPEQSPPPPQSSTRLPAQLCGPQAASDGSERYSLATTKATDPQQVCIAPCDLRLLLSPCSRTYVVLSTDWTLLATLSGCSLR